MSIRLVVFDCDGVMFDSRQANVSFYNEIRAHFGLPSLSEVEADYVHMATTMESVDYIMPVQMREAAQAYRLTMDYGPFTDLMVMEPHLLSLLHFLKPKYKTAVATNRSNTIGPLLDDFGLTSYFDMVVSCLDVTRPKPDPEALRLIMDRLGVVEEETIFIGDSEIDAEAAARAGVALVSYCNLALPAVYHVSSLSEIKEIVEG
jgi:HAD superfamily hydrolase (TIGR01549 family)